MSVGFVTPVGVRWSDIDMYQHVNHATMVTILEEARVPFLKDAFGADITSTGLLIADVRVTYKGQLRLSDSPLQVTIWTKRLRAVDFTLGYEVRSVNAEPDSRPAVIASRSWPRSISRNSGWFDYRHTIASTCNGGFGDRRGG